MDLPLTPPVPPMLATSVPAIPQTPGMVFEPKWDGYRCLVFRDGDEVVLQSRSGKPLTRYFPEVVDALRAALPRRCVVDGELVVAVGDRLSFDALGKRAHAAVSQIRALAESSPASYMCFDLLAIEDVVVLTLPFAQRRDALEQTVHGGSLAHLTPVTDSLATARRWFTLFEGAGLDGLVGKGVATPYSPGKRTMIKIKHARSADCVVAGFRWHAAEAPGKAVGSLLLGLHDEHGVLHHVGVVGAFPDTRRRALVAEIAPLRDGASENHPWLGAHATDGRRLPGGENRWGGGEPWEPLRPERVAEVGYEHTEGGHPARFRQNARFQRWRPDRDPASCGYDQLDEPARYDLDAVLHGEVRTAP
ncbi:MAG TPA: ATP-dependent DNA ligase [Pseudonocardiaceae bacterium]|nr:ATP-dependent DNA ligase [Pseudonocardiaceae bacterium]